MCVRVKIVNNVHWGFVFVLQKSRRATLTTLREQRLLGSGGSTGRGATSTLGLLRFDDLAADEQAGSLLHVVPRSLDDGRETTNASVNLGLETGKGVAGVHGLDVAHAHEVDVDEDGQDGALADKEAEEEAGEDADLNKGHDLHRLIVVAC